MPIKSLIAHAVDGNAVEFRKAFDQAMQQKIGEKIEEIRPAVYAKSFVTQEESVESEEEIQEGSMKCESCGCTASGSAAKACPECGKMMQLREEEMGEDWKSPARGGHARPETSGTSKIPAGHEGHFRIMSAPNKTKNRTVLHDSGRGGHANSPSWTEPKDVEAAAKKAHKSFAKSNVSGHTIEYYSRPKKVAKQSA